MRGAHRSAVAAQKKNSNAKVQLASLQVPARMHTIAPLLQGNPPGFSSIASSFNATAIPAGDFIWFNANFKASGQGSQTVRIFLRSASVQFSSGGTTFQIPVPDSMITFTPSASTAATNYDTSRNEWITTVPATGLSGNTFLSGLSFPVPAGGLPGNISPITFAGTFYSDTPGISVNWQWSAAVYTSFTVDYPSLGVKPVDDNSASIYQNSDHAGTPESYKSFVTAGARSVGGSDFTGSSSGAIWIAPINQVPNSAPVANAGAAQTVPLGSTVQLDGSGSTDPDGDPLTYRWSLTAPTGSTATLSGAATVKPTFVADVRGSYTVQLIVNDGFVDSAPSTVTISTQNSPPVANAGQGQSVFVNTKVFLDGSHSSDVDGDPLTYHWSLTAPTGSAAVLSDPSAVNPSFTVDVKGDYIAQLIVNDGLADSTPSTVRISTLNSPPVANAGPGQTILVGTTVFVNGSGSSDVDGDPLTFHWAILTQPADSNATLSDPSAVAPSFFAGQLGDYVLQLIVNDGTVDSPAATVTITTRNSPPVANAGRAQSVPLLSLVTLDGTGSSDPDGQSITYQWHLISQPTGSLATLADASSPHPTFTADVAGTYVVQLIVDDGFVDSAPASVTASTVNSPPVANPGSAQTILVGSTVHLNGSGSTDVDGNTLTFRWSFSSRPTGSNAVLSDQSAVTPTFFADQSGTYVVQLIVNDGFVDSAPSTVTISTENSPPSANAGPAQTVPLGSLVTLDGSASSDPDGQALTFHWALVSFPPGSLATLTNPDTINPSFTADLAGNYIVQLVVNDGFVNSATSTVEISTINSVPVANAGMSQTVLPGTTVQLDGGGSSDADHDALTYRWALTVLPTGSSAVLSNLNAANPTFVPDVAGIYVAQLIVNDGKVYSAPTTVIITCGTPVLQLTAPPAVTGLPGQTVALNFVATNIGIFDAQQAVFSSDTTTIPLGIITVGQSRSASVSITVPAVPAKGQTESDAAYLTRLQAADNQTLPVTGSVTWIDQAATTYGPVSATTSVTQQIPIISVALSAPATVKAGDPLTYTLTLTNVGPASATVSTASITLPDNSVQSVTLTPSALPLGASVSANVQYTVPPSQTAPLPAVAIATWQDGNANSYGPLSATAVTQINGISAAILASCAPSGSLSVLLQGSNVTSYVPNGSWNNQTTGIRVVPVEGTGTLASVATPAAVNSCSSNSVTGKTVCTANTTDLYLLTDATITNTLQSGSTGVVGTSSPQTCHNCGVAVNAATNQAVLTVGLAGNTAGGIQVLDLATNTFAPPVPTSGVAISEDIAIDPIRNLILSASESSAFEIFSAAATGISVFDQVVGRTAPPQYELDSTAEDCITGIAVAPAESVKDSLGNIISGEGGVFVTDLTQATFNAGPPAIWTGGEGNFQSIPELFSLDGVAVAPGSHLGIAAQESGGQSLIAAFRLPATSGSGTPTLQDWARATIPVFKGPDGLFVTFSGADPHRVTAYISPNPNDGKAYGLVADSKPFFLAVIDLAALLNLPRVPAGSHTVDPTIDLVGTGVIRFVPVAPFLKFPASPSSGQQGTQNLPVEIQGIATHFVQGVTTVNFGAGISIGSLTVNSPTDLTAIVNIDPLAVVLDQVVTVTTGTESVSTPAGGFSITRGPARIAQISPASVSQGQSVTFTITGSATHFAQGVTTVDLGFSGNVSTLTGFTVNSPTSITVTANVSPLEDAVLHTATVTTGGEVVTGTFNVTPSPAKLISVTPNSASQGRQHVTLTVTGQDTHFTQGTTSLTSDAFVENQHPTVISPTILVANVNLLPNATVGSHSITATTIGENATLTNGFNVTPGVPTLLSLGATGARQNSQNLTITLNGAFTHFVQGTSIADFGPGIIVNSLTVSSTTAASANISIDPQAVIGVRSVSVTTGSEVATLINGFTVIASLAVIDTFTPTSLAQGQQNATVTIVGSATHFAQGISVGAFGPGITVNSLTVTSPINATAVVSVDPSATTSPSFAIITSGENALSRSPLTITTGNPELTGITPKAEQPGTQNISVAITGFKTNFVQGTSVANFGAGVTVASLTVHSATSATAVVSVDAAAALGARDVTVTTGTQVARFTSGFLVAPPPPAPSFGLTEGQEITKPTDIVGSVGAGTWVLSYALASQDGTGAAPVFVPFASGTTAITNGVLGTLDPTLLLNGNYIIQLSSTDQFGQNSTVSVNVEVERNVKVGNFTLSFNDLNIPMPGLPITVTRTYDSRDKQSHDFGVGWTLSLVNVRLQKNGQLGARWQITESGSGISTNFCLEEIKPHFVTITFPDGRVFKFQETVTPQCQQLSPIESSDVNFVELPGASNTQGATLSIVGNSNVLVTPPSAGPVDLLDSLTTQEFNPTVFQLTTAEGYVYVIDQTLGATSVTDPNGNQLTINAAGITSSDGKSVAFTRDTQGRITQISDPAGNVLNYSYSGAGDLTAFDDRAGNVTTFSYDGTHLLTSIVDPLGVQAVKNLYDGTGRLTDTIDADGHDVHYDHQLSANTEVITDRLGNVTTYEYDDDGNILHKIQTVNGVPIDTAYSYDGNDNKLSELLPGHLNPSTFTYDGLGDQKTQVDPLGNKTTYSYNANRQVTEIDDANVGTQQGKTVNVYDPATHNLLSTTDAENHVTTYTYFANGQVKTLSVDGVQTASFIYDGTGNLQTQTDANGVSTTYTYDPNGNRLSQTVKRTLPDGTLQPLTTSYQYDANDRLIKTTYPDNSTTQIKYNAIGKQSDVIDQLNHTTHYDYDDQGRLQKTTYADGTFEITGYDLEGRRISFQDRAQRTTTYDYDEIGRLRFTHYPDPDKSFTETVYDASGRVTDTFDALRNKTHYDYDDADRRITVTDAAGNQTSFGYDNVGNQTSITDALQHTTTFSYDRLGRRVLTTYPDQSTESEHYDFLGRVDSKTDQAGKITNYGYDNVGRLKTVTQTLNNVALITSYAYDEVGERISQTDANNHTTLFAYDQLGRRTSRTLPAGGTSEAYVYDLAGNLQSKTDFNGHTTTYAYDNLNRLKSKTAASFFSTGACAGGACGATSVSFTYTATGRRKTMLDATGTTTYNYDTRDRLQSKATPFGTISYTYDDAGNILTLSSSNAGGASMTYGYDALNRVASVLDASGTTTYSYDLVGNLAGYTYPNGVATSYTYDPLNRLTNMQGTCGSIGSAAAIGCGNAGTPLWSYTYTLGPAGNRQSVAELSGRTVNYGYDDLYRLTSETVASDPRGNNGQVSYTLDSVGNRLQRNSSLPAVVPTGLLSYDANDRVSTDSYDANGNTIQNSGQTNIYDFENRLVQRGGVKIVYDGDGNRVQESIAGVTTSYLVADQNPTGYAQVIDELQGGAVTRTYSYGLELINARQNLAGTLTTSFYGMDGHGSVRFLTDSTGAITDTYDYDAFGNLISSTGTTPNNYLFAGEQFDPALGIYYNRARYYDQRQGRFWTMDTFEGSPDEPAALHRYLYASGNPIDRTDPTGFEDIASLSVAEGMNEQLEAATAQAEQALGRKAVRITVCEVGKCIVDLGIQEGVYLLLEQLPGGFVLPYVGQTGDAATRIVTQVSEKNVFGRLLTFIEVEGGVEARRKAEQTIINVLTEGGLQPGVRSLPNAERIISNLRNEIRLDKFIGMCE